MISFKRILFASLLLCSAMPYMKSMQADDLTFQNQEQRAQFLTNALGQRVKMTSNLEFVINFADHDACWIRITKANRNNTGENIYWCVNTRETRQATQEETNAINEFIQRQVIIQEQIPVINACIEQEFEQNHIQIDDAIVDYAKKHNLHRPQPNDREETIAIAKRMAKIMGIEALGSLSVGAITNFALQSVVYAVPGLNVAAWCFTGAQVAYGVYVAGKKTKALLDRSKSTKK